MSDVMSIETEFSAAMAAHDLRPTEIVADGHLHRFGGPEDKRGKKSAWYVLYCDGIPAGSFGDWRTGLSETWCSKAANKMTEAERAANRDRIRAMKEAREAEEARDAEAARAAVAAHWEKANGVRGDHGYVLAKKIRPRDAKQLRDQLLIPLRDIDGTLHSAQYIQPDGAKRFKSGGRVAGCFCLIGDDPNDGDTILIAEGWATACSLHQATRYAVFAAMNAGNLLAVAKAVRLKYLMATIIVCADDDYQTDGNPGLTKAREAAQAVGGGTAIPIFADPRPEGATDFNDQHICGGAQTVRACIEAAIASVGTEALTHTPQPPGTHQREPQSSGPSAKRTESRVVLTRAADVIPEPITWLWPGYLPAGKLTILAGQPGCGKTTIALSLAATVTRGGEWPDGAGCTGPGNVLMWTGEDGVADTLVPRLMAAGADLTRVWFVESVRDADDRLTPFDPSRDVLQLSDQIATMGDVRLLIVDPIISVVQGDGHKSIDVRRSLQPLLDLGTAHNCAIFGITHFSKGSKGSSPLDRILGSQAFGAAARVILIAGKDDSSGRRVFAKSKANIAEEAGGFEYAIDVVDMGDLSSSRIQWGEPLTGSARDILREIEADDADDSGDGEQQSKFERARAMIYELLRPFASTRELKAAAAADGMSWRTVEAAKQAEINSGAKIRAVKQGKEWGWIWDNFAANHPDEASAQVLEFPNFGNDRRNKVDLIHPQTAEATPRASSPQGINSANGNCGVETQAQQGLQAKSATPQSIQEFPRAHARTHAGVPKTHCGLADLTGNPSPVRESTPQTAIADLNDCGLDHGNVRGDL
ncbi:AAA family ATPase [Burkholderia cepacia]|uniref:AAA family ATPase n=1 Tax=Burkholderia cepacia TaxID=292 RepID=UPI00158C8178|nr:AAA family ATPase [Burkholderia cepacia]